MRSITRAEFLKLIAALAGGTVGAAFLSACNFSAQSNPPSPTSASAIKTATRKPGAAGLGDAAHNAASAGIESETPTAATAAPDDGAASTAAPANTEAPTPAQPAAYLGVARGGVDPEALTRAAIDAIGGMRRFVTMGANVIIKPNICIAYSSYEYAATTNPWVVGALVKLCLEAGAGSVRVLDYPFGGSYADAYVKSGIQEQVLAAGGEMSPIAARKFIYQKLPGATVLTGAAILDEVTKADVLINVPIAKNHGLSTLTLGMKNLMGVIQNRGVIHNNFPVMLTELAAYLKPALTVVDAVRILLRNGPTGGSLGDVKVMNTVIASADIVSADAFATTLFNMDALKHIPYIKYAADHGVGRADLKTIDIKDIALG
jgi:uncharacterized protein (DUF362 family)